MDILSQSQIDALLKKLLADTSVLPDNSEDSGAEKSAAPSPVPRPVTPAAMLRPAASSQSTPLPFFMKAKVNQNSAVNGK